MTNKRYVMNASIILWVSVVLMLFIFILVAHHLGVSDRALQDRRVLLGTASNAATGTKPAGQSRTAPVATQPAPAHNAATAPPTGKGQ